MVVLSPWLSLVNGVGDAEWLDYQCLLELVSLHVESGLEGTAGTTGKCEPLEL